MNLHLELTNRCVLQCPACPRTQYKDLLKRPVDKADLNFHDLHNFLDCEQGKKINHFLLCGDYGDCIYYPQLFEFLSSFRNTKRYTIHTNGSYKTEKFWHELAEILTEEDEIVFSVDGLQNTNHIYRINSDWDSIMLGIDIMSRSRAKVTWKTIIFNYNYLDLHKIKEFAESKGCNVIFEKTHRFGNDDLAPPPNFVETNHLYQDSFSSNHTIEIEPDCMSIKTIGCDGIFYPCDWIRNPKTFYKSLLWRNKDRWLSKLTIKNTTYDESLVVIQDWADFVKQSSLNHLPVDTLCKMKCRKGCKKTRLVGI